MKKLQHLILLFLALRACISQQYICNYTECIRRYQGDWDWGPHPDGVTVPGCSEVCIPRNQASGVQSNPLTGNQNHGNLPTQNRNTDNDIEQSPPITGDSGNGAADTNTCSRLCGTQEEVSCGMPIIPPETFIRNGEEAPAHAWPWQLALLKHNRVVASTGNHSCGGSIIAPEWAVTAAHCNPIRGQRAMAGMIDFTNCESPNCAMVTITRVWKHPDYVHNSRQRVRNDIAIIKFSPPVPWGDTISPVCLPKPFQHPLEGTSCYATGWGRQEWLRRSSIPERLQQAHLPLLGDWQCKESYKSMTGGWAFISTQMTCAGDLRSDGANTCKGDSGGPLVCKLPGQFHKKKIPI